MKRATNEGVGEKTEMERGRAVNVDWHMFGHNNRLQLYYSLVDGVSRCLICFHSQVDGYETLNFPEV